MILVFLALVGICAASLILALRENRINGMKEEEE